MFNVTVYLAPAAFGLPGPAMKAAEFEVEAASVEDALDIAWAVCNSAPRTRPQPVARTTRGAPE